ncbi:MAG TPA: hypothetical protein VN688_05045 [Gemmataceae bacterium]|nr:hypothetical protein [Gemmataceae bacterium]
MYRFTKWLPCVAAIGAVLMLGTVSPVRADIELQLQVDGGSVVTYDVANNQGPVMFSGGIGASGASGSSNGSLVTGTTGSGAGFNDLTITYAGGTSNSPGNTSALANQGSFTITNNDSSITHSLHLSVSAQGFTSPNGSNLGLADTVSGSVAAGGQVSGSANAFADATNTLFGTGFGSPGLALTIPVTTSPALGFSVSGVSPDGFSPNGNTYSLTFGVDLTLTGGTVFTGNNGNVVATPEPSSMVAAFTAVPFFGLVTWLRRRKQAA